MRSRKVPDTASPAEYAAGVPLAAGHGFQVLEPTNPVVFLDLAIAGGPQRRRETRLYVELLAHVNPLLARNFYAFCTGDFTRLSEGREVPCGYKGAAFFEAVPGRSLTGGDVVTNSGSTNVSSLSTPAAAKLSAPPLLATLPAAALRNCCGFVYAVATATGTAGSQFRVVFPAEEVPPASLGGIVGRLIARTPGDVEGTLAALQEATKAVWSAQRGAAGTALPYVALCGEM
jgi:cyclophilin family peptidyl-prolyl cis-trans isomerase